MIKKKLSILLFCLSIGMSAHSSTSLQYNHIMLAVMQKNVSLMKDMFNKDESYVEVVRGNVEPLLLATFSGSTDIVRVLLDAGADINGADENSLTPLMIASQLGNKAMVQFLLDNGARVDQLTTEKETALMAAAAWGHVDIVKMLLAAGASATICDNQGRCARDYVFIGQEKLKCRAASDEDDVLILRLLDEPELLIA